MHIIRKELSGGMVSLRAGITLSASFIIDPAYETEFSKKLIEDQIRSQLRAVILGQFDSDFFEVKSLILTHIPDMQSADFIVSKINALRDSLNNRINHLIDG